MTTPTLDEAIEVAIEIIPDLTASDFCDASAGAQAAEGSLAAGSLIPSEQAYVRVEVSEGQYLDLCAHHYAELETVIVTKGYRVLDRRDRLAP